MIARFLFPALLFPLSAHAALIATWTADVEPEPLGEGYGADSLLSGSANAHAGFTPVFNGTAAANLPDVVSISAAGATQTGLTNVVDIIPGTGQGLRAATFQNGYTPEATNASATFDLYLSPDTLTRTDQILFETGGAGNGMSILLVNGTLTFGVSNGAVATFTSVDLGSTYDPTPDFTDFVQIRASIDLPNDVIELSAQNLGTGLTVGSSTAWAGNDWDGGDAAGLGIINGAFGGDNASQLTNNVLADPGVINFDGQIGRLDYFDTVETSLVPEPGVSLLVSAAGFLLLFRRRTR